MHPLLAARAASNAAALQAHYAFCTAFLFGCHIASFSPHLSSLRNIPTARILVAEYAGIAVGPSLRALRRQSIALRMIEWTDTKMSRSEITSFRSSLEYRDASYAFKAGVHNQGRYAASGLSRWFALAGVLGASLALPLIASYGFNGRCCSGE